ncbi:MAG: 50S ribosomal protein L21 [Oscillospiraceae bacterium]|nr:50S ribosomal protein L21 [Oscillospiraceae bacterium]
MKAIIETGGKQFTVSEGDIVYVETLGAEEGETVTFDRVLAIIDGDGITAGAPTLKGSKVTGKLIKNGKQRKVVVYKMKRRKGYRRKQGHRQQYSKVQIETIAP